MKLAIPTPSLILLVGASGSGKSSFARQHFKPTEVISSDYCRGVIADDENDQAATGEAFELLHYIVRKRLAAGRLTVVDATNVQREARQPLLALARQHHCLAVALVLNLPAQLCHQRNQARPERQFGPHVVRRQSDALRRSLRGLEREGFHQVEVLNSQAEVDALEVERAPLRVDRRVDHGPFDLIGDVHGCFDELQMLLSQLGYQVETQPDPDGGLVYAGSHPAGRRVIFLGDLVDRGPDTPGVLRLVMGLVRSGAALCVAGNHENKLLRKLRGRDVQVSHGLAESLAQLATEPASFEPTLVRFLDGLIDHYVLDDGKLVVAHAGLKAELQGRVSRRVRDFALYGETTGETDEYGLPVRYNWAADYRGPAMVVYGHTPVPEPEWLNRTICLDTGCVFGGQLTALRYPERELLAVPAARVYYEPARPLRPVDDASALSAQHQHDDLLDLGDLLGTRLVSTRLRHNITVREEQAITALEVMSRFAVDPKWLIYLPPTMSPCETSQLPGLLEHPAEAFAYFRRQEVARVICEEKHMGSRAVVVVCRDEATARRRFGLAGETRGCCYTRTGRRFFADPALEAELLSRLQRALTASGLWEELATDWVLLDCELLPWSAKAQELLRQQYAAVSAAAGAALGSAVAALDQAAARGVPVEPLLARYRQRAELTDRYGAAYRRYCWPVDSLADYKLAPFHLLASEGAVHANQTHRWHLDTLARLGAADPALLLATANREVDLADPASEAAATTWWQELTADGGEGMVVKPLDFVAQGPRGLIQPAVKCRGPEYLRLIYGPEYSLPEHLERLRARGLGAKRSLAEREFALGLEGLDRFVRGEPLRRIHECAFAVLSLESEAVDPRL